jgi:hypothetical protein
MINLERLQVFDIEPTLNLANEFNTVYGQSKKFNRAKLRSILEASLVYDKNYYCSVLKDNEKVVGLLVGIASEGPYFDEIIASELGWYVQSDYRGRKSIEMLSDFESWAKETAKADFVSMSYTSKMSNLDFLYTKRGYEVVEYTYKKDLK